MEDHKGVEENKQTLNILKRALIQEREERKENGKLADELKSRIKALTEKIEIKASFI